MIIIAPSDPAIDAAIAILLPLVTITASLPRPRGDASGSVIALRAE